MDNKKKSIIVGLSFIGAIALFVWGYNFLKGKSMVKKYPYYYAVYQDVNELSKANKVLVSGMLVGQVEELSFNPKKDGSIIVKFSVSQDVSVPSNSVAYITSDLLGSSSINLVLGDSKTEARLGDTLISCTETGLTDMLADQLLPLKDKVENLVMSIDTLTVSLNNVFDEKMQTDVKMSISDLSLALNNIKKISKDLQVLMDTEKDNLDSIIVNVDNIADNLSTVSDSLAQIKYNTLISSIQSTVDNLNVITADLKDGKGSAGLLLSNDSLYINLNKTVENLSVLIKKIEENPKDYIRIKVF